MGLDEENFRLTFVRMQDRRMDGLGLTSRDLVKTVPG
jgi:hypothetical protein